MSLQFSPEKDRRIRKQVIATATHLMETMKRKAAISGYIGADPILEAQMSIRRGKPFGIKRAILDHIDREERKRTGRLPRAIETIKAFIERKEHVRNYDLPDTVDLSTSPTRKVSIFEAEFEPMLEKPHASAKIF